MVKLKLKRGVVLPPDIPNIFVAAENNDLSALEAALHYYDVNEQDDYGMTPLHYAASSLSIQALDKLLAQPDIDPTLADVFGRSAASIAIDGWGSMADDIIDKLMPLCYPWSYPEHKL